MKFKKFAVLAVLFLLPITVYLFFASGVNNFAKLPVLSYQVAPIDTLKTVAGEMVQLKDRITVLGFFGNEVTEKKANAFNLAHKIYKKNYQFADFQMVFLITKGQAKEVAALKQRLTEIENPVKYKFVEASPEAIASVFTSLETDGVLSKNYSSDRVFIIDKDSRLRGRNDDEDVGILYGYNASDYAEVNNKMSDDIKVILAEYRLALKKYKADREI
ncbi:hypothetical protein [Altibacter sp. HG106]|uniref:hypothetical protein n=1 Tax=Altibacter sp. HG106 TaxID=3023937 RepID=UPI0023509323|nr:hypothetical protein [Altibacter sp. HG106]MDC7994646.1 hypothetical protein [Altibacter sp. HG106]